MDNTFTKPSNQSDALMATLAVAGLVVATSSVFQEAKVAKSVVPKAADLVGDSDDPADFIFQGYSDGELITVIMPDIKDQLILNGVPESKFDNITTATDDIVTETLNTLGESVGNSIPLDTIQMAFTPEGLTEASQITEEFRELNQIDDPTSIENTAFEWASQRSDMMGMFGDLESFKAGLLDTYITAQLTGAEIMLPWNPTGSNTCDDCMQMVDDGPYPVDNFPPPVHTGDQCNDPPADPIIVYGAGLGTNIVGEEA